MKPLSHAEPEDVADMEADRPPQRANARRGPGGRDSDAIDVDDDDDDAMLTAALTASLKTGLRNLDPQPKGLWSIIKPSFNKTVRAGLLSLPVGSTYLQVKYLSGNDKTAPGCSRSLKCSVYYWRMQRKHILNV